MSGGFSVVKPFFSSDPYLARVASAATTNATNVKASSANVYGYVFYNIATNPRYIKFYDKATAPTVGTDTPLFTVSIPAQKDTQFSLDVGIPFKNGLSYAITAGAADSDTAAVAANDVHGAIFWN